MIYEGEIIKEILLVLLIERCLYYFIKDRTQMENRISENHDFKLRLRLFMLRLWSFWLLRCTLLSLHVNFD